jgi:hypothetical protein
VTTPEKNKAELCQEFRAGLALLNMSLSEFSNLTGLRYDTAKNFYQGDSIPSSMALFCLRLMVCWNIDWLAAGAINSPRGVDLREIAKRRLDPEVYDEEVLFRPRPASPGR